MSFTKKIFIQSVLIIFLIALPIIEARGFLPQIGFWKKIVIPSPSSVLMHFDNNLTDMNGNTVTNNGITFSNSTAKFGYSAYINGTYASSNANFTGFGSGDFTVEYWIYLTASAGSYTGIVGQWKQSAYNTNTFAFYFESNGQTVSAVVGLPNNTGATVTASSALSLNSWHHVAFVRNGSTLTLYHDGSSVGSTSVSGSLSTSSYPLYIGGYQLAGSSSIGYIPNNVYLDELRITTGLARYTTNFTPPTAAF